MPTAQPPKTGVVVGIAIGAAVAIAVIIALAIIKPFGAAEQGAEPAVSQEAQAPANQTSIAASEPSGTASQSSEAAASSTSTPSSGQSSTASSTAPRPSENAPAPALVDLSNPEDYYDINIFLSNFAEWEPFWNRGQTYDRENYDLMQLVNWGMWHNAINNEGTLVNQEVNLEGAPASEISKDIPTIPASCYPRHMQTSLIEGSIERYTGLDINLADYNPGDGSYFERDGIMYEGYYRGAANALDGVALATSAENVGGNNVRVSFTIYSGYREFQTVVDKSWYGLDGDSLEAEMRASGSSNVQTRNGTATVEVIDSESERPFRLVSFEVEDAN